MDSLDINMNLYIGAIIYISSITGPKVTRVKFYTCIFFNHLHMILSLKLIKGIMHVFIKVYKKTHLLCSLRHIPALLWASSGHSYF